MIKAKDLAPAKVKDLKNTRPYDCVLLIDDDEITNFLNEDILKGLKLAPLIKCKNGADEALTFLSNVYASNGESSTLIFLDLIMSSNEKDGFDFLSEIHPHPYIPESCIDIIILTNSLDKINREKAEKYNIMDYVSKPLSGEKIRACLGKKLIVEF